MALIGGQQQGLNRSKRHLLGPCHHFYLGIDGGGGWWQPHLHHVV